MSSILHSFHAPTLNLPALARIVAKATLRTLTWPARVMRARQDMALLAAMSPHELRDIGLTRSDIANATALAMDDDPTVFLARVACDARARRHQLRRD